MWEKVVRKLRNGQMPPLGAPQPDAATTGRFVDGARRRRSTARPRPHPNPGRPMLHRLNRAEYANAIRDLLAPRVDATALLPADESSCGFDNIADALGVSPLLIERYLAAADGISRWPWATATIAAGSDTYRGPRRQHQPITSRGCRSARAAACSSGRRFRSTAIRDQRQAAARPTSASRAACPSRTISSSASTASASSWTPSAGPRTSRTCMANPAYADDVDARLTARVPVKAGAARPWARRSSKTGARNVSVFKPLQAPVDTVDSDGVPQVESVTIAGRSTRPARATPPAAAQSSPAGRRAARRAPLRDDHHRARWRAAPSGGR